MFVKKLFCDCSQSIYHKTKKGVIPSEITPFNFIYLSSGEPTRTTDLWVMSPTSYHCSTPQSEYRLRFKPLVAGSRLERLTFGL